MDYSLNQGKFSEFGQLSVSSFQTYHGHLMIPGIYYRYAQQYLNVLFFSSTVYSVHQEEWSDSVSEGPDRSARELQVPEILGVAGPPGGGCLPCSLPPVLDSLPSG